MGTQGRPLRFLVLVIGGWTGARVALLWPHGAAPSLPSLRGLAAAPAAAAAPLPIRTMIGPLPQTSMSTWHSRQPPRRAPVALSATVAFSPALPPRTPAPSPPLVLALDAGPQYGAAQPVAATPQTASRWSGSAWALLRNGRGRAGVATPQLGGSQAGVRLAYNLDAHGRLAAVARVASALRVRQQEAAVGIEWRPTRAPLRLVAEQRIAIAGARGGAALGIVGGVSEVPLAAGVRLDGYVQAGVIARAGGEGYGDGALRVGGTVARSGPTRLDLGLGAWGAAQRGASRLDAGPSAALVLPIAGRAVRLGLEWRERLAGDARPGSGAVLSLGADF